MSRYGRPVAAAILTFLLALSIRPAISAEPPAAAKPQSADVPLVGEKVRGLMQDRNYAEALEAIEAASKAADAPKDYLAYLKGRALSLQGQYDPAVETFTALEKQFPKSPWARRARFAQAVALARKGDFRSAELIYRNEAEYLLSADRKQEIADIYLEFADTYFKPPKEDQKPDYQKALEFYQKALEVGPKPEKRVEVELLVAQCHQHLGKHAEAASLYEKFIKAHPESPLDVEARFRLGQCRLAEGNAKEARRTWQDLLAKYPDSQSELSTVPHVGRPETGRRPQPEPRRRRTRSLHRAVPHAQAGQPGPPGDRPKLRPSRPLRRRRHQPHSVPPGRALSGPQRDPRRPQPPGPLLPVAEEIPRSARHLAGVPH
jgi:TolA-binding protein